MKMFSDEELKDVFDYLAWRHRCSFKDDFMNKTKEFFIAKGHDEAYALVCSLNLWNSYINIGIVETYQKYIGGKDTEMLEAFIYALNNN